VVDRGFERRSGQTKDIGISYNNYTCLQFLRVKVSELFLLNANLAMFQLCHGENKFNFNEMTMRYEELDSVETINFLYRLQ
jgi:hypothetical protein